MGPLMEQRQKHREFVCRKCATSSDTDKHQALPVLRLMRLYALVWMQNRRLAMRSAPMHILIHAPKDDTNWGIGHQAPNPQCWNMPAFPSKMELLERDGFSYGDQESQNIWLYASHFQDNDQA